MGEQGAGCWQNCDCNASAARLHPGSPGPLPGEEVFTLRFEFLNRAALGTWVQAPGASRLGAAGLLSASAD